MKIDKGTTLETIRFLVTVFVLWLIIRMFVVQPFLVDGESMSPNFETTDYLLVDKFSYFIHPPARGDVIVFKFPEDTSKYFIKRVIGLPGETVTVHDSVTTITKKDGSTFTVPEPFVTYKEEAESKTLTLGETEYFVMGDNRSHSYDSRSWGPLDKKYIGGRALIRLVRLSPFNIKVAEFLPAKIQDFGLTTLDK